MEWGWVFGLFNESEGGSESIVNSLMISTESNLWYFRINCSVVVIRSISPTQFSESFSRVIMAISHLR